MSEALVNAVVIVAGMVHQAFLGLAPMVVGELDGRRQGPQEALALGGTQLAWHVGRRHAFGEVGAKVQGKAPPERVGLSTQRRVSKKMANNLARKRKLRRLYLA